MNPSKRKNSLNLLFNSLDFKKPNIPIVDGRGDIWSPWSTDKKELYNYTLNDQIISTYDFSKSISVSLKEFCPDHIVLLGPGNSLGAPVAQALINHNWNELKTKTDFLKNFRDISRKILEIFRIF